VGGWFTDRILVTGRLPLFCFFVAFLVTFLFIRLSVRLIRAQVKWWPGNVKPGGLHIHHVVFGVVLMVIGGLAGLAVPDEPVGLPSTCAVVFGIGTALVLDEFALILHLEDVYWAKAGRLSVDAIFVAAGVTGMLLLGVVPFVADDLRGATQMPSNASAAVALAITLFVNFGLAAITLLKGKVWTGLFGLFLPILLVVGAIRIGRPASPWARRLYTRRPRKAAKSRRREIRTRRRFVRVKNRIQDLLAGRPDVANAEIPEQPSEQQPSEQPKV
jgi:hypothetical protein